METSQAKPFITPTLQSNWNYAINEVLKRMNNLDIGETWKAVETLFQILPPKIYEKVEKEYKAIVKRVNEANNGSGVDYQDMIETNREACTVLEVFAIPFFRKMYSLLYNGGYLEKLQRELPIGKE